MPNIEIHGLSPEQAKQVELRLSRMSNWDDLVITTVPDRVVDRHGNASPFLRIWNDSSTTSTIVAIVQKHFPDMDIEAAPRLAWFIKGKT